MTNKQTNLKIIIIPFLYLFFQDVLTVFIFSFVSKLREYIFLLVIMYLNVIKKYICWKFDCNILIVYQIVYPDSNIYNFKKYACIFAFEIEIKCYAILN